MADLAAKTMIYRGLGSGIVRAMREDSHIDFGNEESAMAIGDITEDGVKFTIGKLQQKGLLKRVGGRKHGEWQVLSDD